MTPKLSVVIPTYKAAPWIEETLSSLARQSYAKDSFEIVIVDDKSPDDSVEITKRCLAKHPLNARVIELEKNGGVPTARNTGMQAATGEWIQFLDQDDLLTEHKLARQIEVAERTEPEVGVVYSAWQYLTLEGDGWQRTGGVNVCVVDRDPIVEILQDWRFGYVGPCLIRKAHLTKIGGFLVRPNIGEDTDLMLRLAMAGSKFRHVDLGGPGLLYRQSPNSLWRNYAKNIVAMRNLIGTYEATEDFLRQSNRAPLSPEARRALAGRYASNAEFYLLHDRPTFDVLTKRLRGLDYQVPPQLSRGMRLAARTLGYANALRLRLAARRLLRKPPG